MDCPRPPLNLPDLRRHVRIRLSGLVLGYQSLCTDYGKCNLRAPFAAPFKDSSLCLFHRLLMFPLVHSEDLPDRLKDLWLVLLLEFHPVAYRFHQGLGPLVLAVFCALFHVPLETISTQEIFTLLMDFDIALGTAET